MVSCRIKKLVAIVGLSVGIGCSLPIYNYTFSRQGQIYHFNAIRDTQPLLDIFKKNKKELTDEDNYSLEYMLKHRKPDESSPCLGLLRTKVIREKNKLAGFTSYYMENEEKGMILFLAVDHDFRGKGYGKVLMQAALKDLVLMGAENVGIWVAINNIPAKRIYKELGFIEKDFDDNENVYLEFCPLKSKKTEHNARSF